LVDASTPNAANLHLSATDIVARDAGTSIDETAFGPPIDADQDTRPAGSAWDIGADEIAASPTATTTVSTTAVETPGQLPTATPSPPTTACPPVPEQDCRVSITPRKSEVALGNSLKSARDVMRWAWRKGVATTKTEFGSPTTTTSYALCMYHDGGGTQSLRLSASVPPAGVCGARACWRSTRHGFTFAAREPIPGGITSIKLKEGTTGRAAVTLSARGSTLAMPPLPFPADATVVVQLKSSTGVCWQTEHSPPAVKNDAKRFRDRD
jgi:hypothetical protein